MTFKFKFKTKEEPLIPTHQPVELPTVPGPFQPQFRPVFALINLANDNGDIEHFYAVDRIIKHFSENDTLSLDEFALIIASSI